MAANYIEALLPAPFDTGSLGLKDFRWNNDQPLGSPDTVTFKFLTAPPNHAAVDGTGFEPLIDAQQAAARAVVGLYEQVCGINFEEVGAGANADLLFGRNSQSPAGYAYFPELLPSSDTVDGGRGGDIWVSTLSEANLEVNPGEAGWRTLIHETGHALGLKHPGSFSASDEPPYLPNSTNSSQYSVMSYNGHPFGRWRTITETDGGFTSNYHSIEPSTLMLYDIAAMQYLYGANLSTRTGNDTYTFDPDEPFLQCIWDAGGKDTISVANFSEGCKINLNAGKFSSITILPEPLPFGSDDTVLYDGTNNLSIAFGVRIENATGGSGSDTLAGNKFANLLKGNAGNDVLNGGGGNDNLNGGGGSDNLNGGAGKDKLFGGAGNDVLIWQASNTKVDGGGGNDTLKVTKGKLDLTVISESRILNIETIDMTGGKAGVLTLNEADVLAISRTNVLKVLGSANDDVTIHGDWGTAAGPTGFDAYTSGAATLLVDLDVGVTLVA